MAQPIDRLESAVRTLVAEGSVKQRLVRAYADHLEPLAADDMPQRLDAPLAALHATMHRVPPAGSEGPVRASVQKMSQPEAGQHAAAILELYVELLRLGQRAEPLKVVESPPPAAANASTG